MPSPFYTYLGMSCHLQLLFCAFESAKNACHAVVMPDLPDSKRASLRDQHLQMNSVGNRNVCVFCFKNETS